MNAGALSLRDLEYLVAVAEERHFGRAALRCNVSQPALSAQIRKLEAALGVTLFERTSRRVLPTASGESVTRQARAVLAEAGRLIALADQEAGRTSPKRLSLGAIQTLGPYLFPLVLRRLRETFPGLALALSEGRTAELVDDLRDGRLDAALLSPPFDDQGLAVDPLFTEAFVLACPADHPLARQTRLEAASLAGPELLLLDEGNCLRDQTLAACASGPGQARHATSLETLRSMVAAGGGYTLMPRLAARGTSGPDGLVAWREFPEATRPGRDIVLASRATDPRTASFARLAAFFRANAPDGTLAFAASPSTKESTSDRAKAPDVTFPSEVYVSRGSGCRGGGEVGGGM